MGAVVILWAVWNAVCMSAYGMQPPTENITTISSVEELVNWYQAQNGEGNTAGVLAGNLVVSRPVELNPVELNPPEALDEKKTVDLWIPAGKTVRIVTQGKLTVNNPSLVIHGRSQILTVSGTGVLDLKQGQIDAEVKSEPAIILEDNGILHYAETFQTRGLFIKDNRMDGPEAPTDPSGGTVQGAGPKLTEAILQSLDAEGKGSARLEFDSLPSDISALYLYRSRDGKSWTKEKKKLTAAAQGGQDTVEYENFLKETGNTLNTSIVEDKYLIYNFQYAYESFYVKAKVEWPGGEQETDKVKITIPVYVGQGSEITYSYGGGTRGFSGYYSNLGGQLTFTPSHDTGGTQEETDAPEAPVRGSSSRSGSGSGSSSYIPQDSKRDDQADGLEEATPSSAKAAATPSSAKAAAPSDGKGGTETGRDGLLPEEEEGNALEADGSHTALTETDDAGASGPAGETGEGGGQESFEAGSHTGIIYGIAGTGVVLLLCGAVLYVHRRSF